MSSPPTSSWQDRRGMFQKGKEVHPSDRRFSGSSGSIADTVRKASISSIESVEKAVSSITPSSPNTSKAPAQPEVSAGPPSPTTQRRRSSNTGLFGSLTDHKRGSKDYNERRASHTDQYSGGMFSGWYGKTFRGVNPVEAKQPEAPAPTTPQAPREPPVSVWQDRRGMFQKGRER